jgi:zinc D-Ala-D-Ala carboxypeptidase
MSKLSKYLTYDEGVRSHTARVRGIDNTPNAEQLANMKHVATKIFDPVREHIGGPLFAASFFRCPALNEAVGGSDASQHMKGEAIDIDCDHFKIGTNKQVFDFIRNNLEFDQMIWEFGTSKNPDWVHVSLKRNGKNRRKLTLAVKENGKTVYKPWKP